MTLAETYEYLKKAGCTTEVKAIGRECGTGWFANDVEETAMKEQKANIFEYCCRNKGEKEKRFLWVTDIKLTGRNLEEMVNAGRGDAMEEGINEYFHKNIKSQYIRP